MKKILLSIATIFLLTLLLVFFPIKPVVTLFYGNLDNIQKARIGTQWVLKRRELTISSQEIRKWLIEYHGEAQGQEVIYTFIDWGLTHQKDFIEIIEGIEPIKQDELIERIVHGIGNG